MLEFATASASSKDPAALATILSERSADGWNVVSIVTTASEVTAFLSRVAISAPVPAATTAYTPAAATPAAEPAGWAVAPEPSPAPAAMAPISTPAYQPAAAAAPAVPAGWYADPAGRFDLRYWDGGAWTEHVSRAGQQYTDSPTA
jgi:hypothetical protein